MRSGRTFVFHVSDVRIEVETNHEPTLNAMEAVWSFAGPALPHRATVRGVVRAGATHGEVILGPRRGEAPNDDLLPAFELYVYEALPGWHLPPRVLLHAAAVAVGDVPVLLVGPSGPGKSSLALALLMSDQPAEALAQLDAHERSPTAEVEARRQLPGPRQRDLEAT